MKMDEVKQFADAFAAAFAPVLADAVGSAVGSAVKEAIGDDPYREERRKSKETFRDQEKARLKIKPIEEVLEAGSGAGDVLIHVRLRDRYSHRMGGNPDNVHRGPKTILVPFREAWSASALYPDKGNTARWEGLAGSKDGQAVYGAEALAATVRAIVKLRDQAQLAYAREERRTAPAELRCTLSPFTQLTKTERAIPPEAAW